MRPEGKNCQVVVRARATASHGFAINNQPERYVDMGADVFVAR